MPSAPLRVCAAPRCPNRVVTGYCPDHQRQAKARHRPQGAHGQGYTRQWEYFRTVVFPSLLADIAKAAICGARLAPGPSPHSRCARDGRIEGRRLHLDHDPPLQDWERTHPHRVCDPARVAFLCRSCHGRKTRTEQGR